MESQFAFTVDRFNAAAAAGAKIYIIDDGSKIDFAQPKLISYYTKQLSMFVHSRCCLLETWD